MHEQQPKKYLKILKWFGITLACLLGAFLLLVGFFQGKRAVDKIGRMPEGSRLAFVDTVRKPTHAETTTSTPPHLVWPVPEAYQSHATSFHWWESKPDIRRINATDTMVRNTHPTTAVVFDFPQEGVPIIAAFTGTVHELSRIQAGNQPTISEIELSDGVYVATYNYLLSDSLDDARIKNGTVFQQGEVIGKAARIPTMAFSDKNLGPWKTNDVVQQYNFLFSMFEVSGDERVPVWLDTGSFGE